MRKWSSFCLIFSRTCSQGPSGCRWDVGDIGIGLRHSSDQTWAPHDGAELNWFLRPDLVLTHRDQCTQDDLTTPKLCGVWVSVAEAEMGVSQKVPSFCVGVLKGNLWKQEVTLSFGSWTASLSSRLRSRSAPKFHSHRIQIAFHTVHVQASLLLLFLGLLSLLETLFCPKCVKFSRQRGHPLPGVWPWVQVDLPMSTQLMFQGAKKSPCLSCLEWEGNTAIWGQRRWICIDWEPTVETNQTNSPHWVQRALSVTSWRGLQEHCQTGRLKLHLWETPFDFFFQT